ncbi:SusC/RagA family TonB-linked outer membrane protein [Membranihabitans marinus]|uniref:SusC/RagA family TonB-linked outer membrane protein n=1 Tax=Membranihabitans marinus TaxID=1227546 RepID=UPI001F2D1D13|nr:TonB-dependent receptor [Membranihabitans marinus]
MEKTKTHHFNKKLLLLLLFSIFTSLATYGQSTSQVTGKIVDVSGEPLIGVNVLVQSTNVGTASDFDGNFTLSNVDLNSAVLVASYIGYKTQTLALEGNSNVTITLISDSEILDELVVVGYGSQSREVLTTSVSKLDNAVLENVPFANAATAMQGTVSGVRVQSTSGQPGAAPRIIVRGGTSINNPDGAAPLYVIDGVIRPNMDNLSADDIESLQVLKDAASTAIYGARGSNGVVVITTKGGQVGQASITYSSDFTFSSAERLYDLASARDYIYFGRRAMVVNDAYPDASFRLTGASGFGTGNDLTNNTAYTTQYLTPENQHKLDEGWESMPDPIDPSKTIIFKNTDYQDVLFREAFSQNHYLSASGGTEKATFSASLGYLENQGIAISTDMSRYTLNVNGDFKISDRLSFFGRTNYAKSKDHQVNNITNNFARGLTLPPTAKYYFEDGTLAPGEKTSEGNPEYYLNNRDAENTSENLTLSFGSKYNILPNLSFEPQVSIYNVNDDSYDFQPGFFEGVSNFVDSRRASVSNYKWRQTQADAVFSYLETIQNVHNFDIKAGLSYFDRTISTFSAVGQGASTDLIPTLNASAEPISVSSSVSDQVIMGYFGRINYDFDSKYLLSINMRYDGASNLGANYKWGFFPGVSVGWNLHKEAFWSSLPEDLLTLKLRGSYGVNGNIGNLGDFTSQGAYGVGAIYSGLAAIQNTIIPNPELQWERSKTLNIGADIGLFNRRVNVIFDAYRRETDNLITSLALPPSTGFGSSLTNLGSLENKGVELELNINVLPNESELQWNIGFNASKVSNKILALPENGVENNRIGGFNVWDEASQEYVWKGGLQEGSPIGEYYEYRKLGVYATDEEAANAPYDNIPRVKDAKYGGDVIWDDIDGNGEIDGRDRVYMGNIYPDWTGGMSNSFSYKNLFLSFRLDYTVGHTIWNFARGFMDGQWKLNMNLTQDMVDNAWQEQGDITNTPRYDWESTRAQGNISPGRAGQDYYEKGDYLAVREVTFGYELPQSILSAVNINKLRLNVTGNNLHYFTQYKGLNPEEGGRDYGRYPVPRNLILGLSISF